MEFCQFIWDDNPPGSIQSHPNNLQTPSKHPQAPFRQPQIIPHICHFFSTYTIFGSIFLHANAQKLAKNCVCGEKITNMRYDLRLSGRCLRVF